MIQMIGTVISVLLIGSDVIYIGCEIFWSSFRCCRVHKELERAVLKRMYTHNGLLLNKFLLCPYPYS